MINEAITRRGLSQTHARQSAARHAGHIPQTIEANNPTTHNRRLSMTRKPSTHHHQTPSLGPQPTYYTPPLTGQVPPGNLSRKPNTIPHNSNTAPTPHSAPRPKTARNNRNAQRSHSALRPAPTRATTSPQRAVVIGRTRNTAAWYACAGWGMAGVVPARRAIVVQEDNSRKPATHPAIRAGGQAAHRRVWRCISTVCWDEGGEGEEGSWA
jgi:hypothetical protein